MSVNKTIIITKNDHDNDTDFKNSFRFCITLTLEDNPMPENFYDDIILNTFYAVKNVVTSLNLIRLFHLR